MAQYLKYMHGLAIGALFIFGCILQTTYSKPTGEDFYDGSNIEDYHASLAVIVSIVCVISAIKLLALCAEFCKKQQTFKEFTNENPEEQGENGAQVPADFSMYPPVENTPDSVAHAPTVTFEPLPDISQLRPLPETANITQLRPKVSIAPAGNDEADDYDVDDVARARDPSQDKMKLHHLLSNTRQQIPREQVQYIKELGVGWFGKVLQGEGQKILPGHKKTKIVIQMLKEDAGAFDQLSFLQEGIPYREIDHVNVMKLYGQCIEAAPYLNVLELCPFGDLKTYLRSHRVAVESFNDKGLLLKFAADIAAGLQAMHEHNYVHRDLAARNCLLASDLTVKVGDYGLGEHVFKEDYFFDKNGDALPIRWLAPECVSAKDGEEVELRAVTKACNIWSFGVVIWEILTFGKMPYADLTNDHVVRLVIREKDLTLPRPDVPVSHLDRLTQLMQLCWTKAPLRPNLRQLRIMLLHLLSNKINSHSTEFERKWNQLMPRKQPVIPGNQLNDTTGNQTVVESYGAVPYREPNVPRGNGFESDFNKGSQKTSTHTENNPSNPFSSNQQNNDLTADKANLSGTPVNELSLAAELSGFSMLSSDTAPVNDKSLADELGDVGQLIEGQASLETNATDDIVILDSAGDRVNNEESSTDDDIKVHSSNNDTNITTPLTDVSNSAFMSPLDDFGLSTSTPKKIDLFSSSDSKSTEAQNSYEPDKNEITHDNIENSNSNRTTSMYQTAFDVDISQASMESGSSLTSRNTEEEQSMFGERKFAAMLQTVVTSFDDDEGSWSFDNTGTSFEAIPEEDEASLAAATSDVFVQDTPTSAPNTADIFIADSPFSTPVDSKTNDKTVQGNTDDIQKEKIDTDKLNTADIFNADSPFSTPVDSKAYDETVTGNTDDTQKEKAETNLTNNPFNGDVVTDSAGSKLDTPTSVSNTADIFVTDSPISMPGTDKNNDMIAQSNSNVIQKEHTEMGHNSNPFTGNIVKNSSELQLEANLGAVASENGGVDSLNSPVGANNISTADALSSEKDASNITDTPIEAITVAGIGIGNQEKDTSNNLDAQLNAKDILSIGDESSQKNTTNSSDLPLGTEDILSLNTVSPEKDQSENADAPFVTSDISSVIAAASPEKDKSDNPDALFSTSDIVSVASSEKDENNSLESNDATAKADASSQKDATNRPGKPLGTEDISSLKTVSPGKDKSENADALFVTSDISSVASSEKGENNSLETNVKADASNQEPFSPSIPEDIITSYTSDKVEPNAKHKITTEVTNSMSTQILANGDNTEMTDTTKEVMVGDTGNEVGIPSEEKNEDMVQSGEGTVLDKNNQPEDMLWAVNGELLHTKSTHEESQILKSNANESLPTSDLSDLQSSLFDISEDDKQGNDKPESSSVIENGASVSNEHVFFSDFDPFSSTDLTKNNSADLFGNVLSPTTANQITDDFSLLGDINAIDPIQGQDSLLTEHNQEDKRYEKHDDFGFDLLNLGENETTKTATETPNANSLITIDTSTGDVANGRNASENLAFEDSGVNMHVSQ